jgi:hypothetical protein
MKNLEILIIDDCPLRELPFKKAEGECDFTDDECMLKLKQLVLARTQISEVSFHEGVCPNLQYLFLVQCFELRGIRGISCLAKLHYLYVSPCLKVEALPGVEHHLIPFKESDVTVIKESEVTEDDWLTFLQRMGTLTNAIIYVNKCHEIVEAKDLGYLIDQWWLLLLAANREDEDQKRGGVAVETLFSLSRSAYW